MPIRASIWIFGAEDEYTESRQKFEKAVQTFKDYFYVLNRYEDMDQDLRELFVGSDDEDVVLERLRKVKKQLEEQTEDKIDISDDIDELVTELNRILLKDYTDGRKSDKNDDDWFKTTRYKYCEDYLLRFIHLYVENKSRYSFYQRAQEIIDFSDEDYANWKKQ